MKKILFKTTRVVVRRQMEAQSIVYLFLSYQLRLLWLIPKFYHQQLVNYYQVAVPHYFPNLSNALAWSFLCTCFERHVVTVRVISKQS